MKTAQEKRIETQAANKAKRARKREDQQKAFSLVREILTGILESDSATTAEKLQAASLLLGAGSGGAHPATAAQRAQEHVASYELCLREWESYLKNERRQAETGKLQRIFSEEMGERENGPQSMLFAAFAAGLDSGLSMADYASLSF